jgi:hypothetical protein
VCKKSFHETADFKLTGDFALIELASDPERQISVSEIGARGLFPDQLGNGIIVL